MSADARTDMLDQVPAILYIAEPGATGAWTYVSSGIERLLGYTAAAWQADPTLWAARLHPGDRDWVLSYEATALAAGSDESDAIEYRIRHRDGHVLWVRDDSILRSEPGGPARWHGVISDITDQKLLILEVERRAAASAAIAQLSAQALVGRSLDQLFKAACTQITAVLDVESAIVGQANGALDAIELLARHSRLVSVNAGSSLSPPPGQPPALQPETRKIIVAGSAVGHTLLTGEPVRVDDWASEQRFLRPRLADGHDIASSVCVRIECDARSWGVIGAHSSQPRAFSEADVSFMQTVANLIAAAVARRDAEVAIEHRALHDSLTGLPNRVLLTDRIEHATAHVRRAGDLAALLFVDIDRFKHVNDTLGHHIGDDLLVAIAGRLRDTVRPTDTVARLGGDEFGILLEGVATTADARATSDRIAAAFADPVMLASGPHFVTASVGIAITDGEHSPADLLREADAAMYRAKERGRGRYEVFDEGMRAGTAARSALESDLRRALHEGTLELRYEPIVDLRSDSVIGVEAQLRWEHPEHGLVPPAELSETARSAGLMDQIWDWLLQHACRDADIWQPAGAAARQIRLGLDLPVNRIADPKLADQTAATVAAASIRPDLLQLEVGAGVLLQDDNAMRAHLQRLRQFGFGLVLDRFGRSQFSVETLDSMPFRAVKLDRRITAALCSRGTEGGAARGIVALAHALSLDVVALGVEHQEQVDVLRELGCDKVQGDLIAPPMTPAEIAALLVR